MGTALRWSQSPPAMLSQFAHFLVNLFSREFLLNISVRKISSEAAVYQNKEGQYKCDSEE